MASATHPGSIPLTPAEHPDIETQAAQSESTHASITSLPPVTPRQQFLVLLSSFLTIVITIGFNQSYGVFQSYYISPTQTMLPRSTSTDNALVAFVGTLGTGLTWAGSILVNPVMARLGLRGTRGIGVMGVLLMSTGYGLASLCTQVS